LLAIAIALGTGVARLAWLIPGIWLLPFAALGTLAGVAGGGTGAGLATMPANPPSL
jgi:hypothetical protein